MKLIMNEKLEAFAELAKVQNTDDNVTNCKVDLQTFANLIIRDVIKEMTQQLYWHREDQSNNPKYYKAIEKTLQTFGVENE